MRYFIVLLIYWAYNFLLYIIQGAAGKKWLLSVFSIPGGAKIYNILGIIFSLPAIIFLTVFLLPRPPVYIMKFTGIFSPVFAICASLSGMKSDAIKRSVFAKILVWWPVVFLMLYAAGIWVFLAWLDIVLAPVS